MKKIFLCVSVLCILIFQNTSFAAIQTKPVIKFDNPYSDSGSNSYKGQLHCHSTKSDGHNSPAEVVTGYKKAGYDFITITDHNSVTNSPNVKGITWIGDSVEETYGRHLTAYDISEKSPYSNTQNIIDFHRNRNDLISFAHPNWLGYKTKVTENEIKSLNNLNFIEVYNPTCKTNGEAQWDWVLSAGKKVFGIAVDDCHDVRRTGFNRGWVVVRSNSNSKESILRALKTGNFYASTGNDISISISGNTIKATSSVVSTFSFIAKDGKVVGTSKASSSASYTVKGNEGYIRVESVNEKKHTEAWSQPIFVNTYYR